jgi:hypothetical protein
LLSRCCNGMQCEGLEKLEVCAATCKKKIGLIDTNADLESLKR